MTERSPDNLPPELNLALAWSPPKVRVPLRIVFQLDRRLSRMVARTSEPMLGQMRLAWWRDALVRPPNERPRGDVVLDAISTHWIGQEAALIAMVDGWEVMITAVELNISAINAFAKQRSAFFGALAPDSSSETQKEFVAMAGTRWALADAASSVSSKDERAALITAGLGLSSMRGRLPKDLRGLAVLDALSLRALGRGGRPLLEGRGASLVATKAAILLM